MHVAFVVANYPPHVGGVERHVQHLAREFGTRGIRTTVFTLEDAGERRSEGGTVVGLGRHAAVGDVLAFPSLSRAAGLAGALRDRAVSHVSVHTRFFPATWLGLWAGHRVDLPVVLTEHGGGHVAAGGPAVRTAARAIDWTAGRWAMRRADALLAVSAQSARFCEALSGREPTVCGNGIDSGWWAPDSPVADEPRLVFVGRIVAEKGWRDMLDLVDRIPGVPVDVLGDGPDMPSLRSAIRERGMVDRVTLRGRVGPDEVRRALRGAVYVNPSRASEGLQTTLLEAAAAGARIATYDVGGAEEAASVGAVIRRAPVGDVRALTELARNALGERWRPPVDMDRYSWSRIADLYQSTLAGCP